jgi:hypothetical protein
MNKVLIAMVAVFGLGIFALCTRGADMQAEHSMTGVLIDNACGDKAANEADAAKHKMTCAKKESCAASGYQLIVGDKHYKFDDKGNEQAKAYLEKADTTHVTVMGTMAGDDKMNVTSIKSAEAKG